MNNCSSCMSNPKNKIYYYQTFESRDKNKTHGEDLIIEGIENQNVPAMEQVSKETDEFKRKYASYVECSMKNAEYCKSLLEDLERMKKKLDYTIRMRNIAVMQYDSCQRVNQTCSILYNNIVNVQQNLRIMHDDIKNKQNSIKTCETDLVRCNELKQNIDRYKALLKASQDKVNKYRNELKEINC